MVCRLIIVNTKEGKSLGCGLLDGQDPYLTTGMTEIGRKTSAETGCQV